MLNTTRMLAAAATWLVVRPLSLEQHEQDEKTTKHSMGGLLKEHKHPALIATKPQDHEPSTQPDESCKHGACVLHLSCKQNRTNTLRSTTTAHACRPIESTSMIANTNASGEVLQHQQ